MNIYINSTLCLHNFQFLESYYPDTSSHDSVSLREADVGRVMHRQKAQCCPFVLTIFLIFPFVLAAPIFFPISSHPSLFCYFTFSLVCPLAFSVASYNSFLFFFFRRSMRHLAIHGHLCPQGRLASLPGSHSGSGGN